MNEELRATLEAVRSGALSVDEAALRLKKAPFEDLGYAKVDLHRAVRQGAAEVIYGAGKTPAQIAGIAARMRTFVSPHSRSGERTESSRSARIPGRSPASSEAFVPSSRSV